MKVFERLNSTNTKLWEELDRGSTTPLAAIALEQTEGKGQWGRNWISTKGGLYLSLALALDLALEHNFHLIMATAWGIATVLRAYGLPVTIKWSNDLILDNSKLGGIKIETKNIGNKINLAVVGVGINWQNTAPDPGINLQDYYQKNQTTGIDSLEELTAIACYGIISGYQYYLAVGSKQLLADYCSILNSIGKQIEIDRCRGEVIGVTESGKLQVKLRSPGASTTIAFAPGEISLGYS